MLTMTSAEFAKANLAALSEPVSVRRYTKVIGVYYPEGFEPAELVLDQPDLALLESPTKLTAKRFEELEDEIRFLKRELARRPETIAGVDQRLFVDAVSKTKVEK
jgi:hypothetical protein